MVVVTGDGWAGVEVVHSHLGWLTNYRKDVIKNLRSMAQDVGVDVISFFNVQTKQSVGSQGNV